MKETAKLLVSCPDQHGLVARISDFVFRNGGNFLHLTSTLTFTLVFSWPGPSGNWTDFRFRGNESASAFKELPLNVGCTSS